MAQSDLRLTGVRRSLSCALRQSWRPAPSRCVTEQGQSADASTLVEQEGDLHDHPELGHAIVLHHGLELLGPDGLDVADRAGRALDRFPDCVLVALRGLA